MKLRKQDQEFRNPRVFYPDPKNIDLDRVLIILFVYLRSEGTRPVTRGRQNAATEKVKTQLEALQKKPLVRGFQEHAEVAAAWLRTDIFDLVNRDKPGEAIASLRPLHLDAHKIRVFKHCRDYNHADALYAMLAHGEQQAVTDLRRFLERGLSNNPRRYDGSTKLDLETLTVLKLVEGVDDTLRGKDLIAPYPPTCRGQSRLLCDDVQRLLAYQDVVPRPVMIEYLKTVLGLHLGLYVLRLCRQLSGWIQDKQANPTCKDCPVHGSQPDPFAKCPYPIRLTVDMGGDFRSRMAQLAQDSLTDEHARLLDLVRAVFAMNQLLRYANEEKLKEDPFEVPGMLGTPPAEFEADFKAAVKELVRMNQEEGTLTPEAQAILDANLPPFETLIELVTHTRQKHHMVYLVQMVDKLFQKNSPFGALVQGRSTSNPRRWHLGGRLLEVFVQLAVLKYREVGSGKQFYTEPLLIDDFLRWLEERYGFVIAPSISGAGRKPVTLDEHRAFRENVRALKDRLREIGFYDDLSDAYNAQTVQPRYQLSLPEVAR